MDLRHLVEPTGSERVPGVETMFLRLRYGASIMSLTRWFLVHGTAPWRRAD